MSSLYLYIALKGFDKQVSMYVANHDAKYTSSENCPCPKLLTSLVAQASTLLRARRGT